MDFIIISGVIGSILLILLITNDFTKRVLKPKKAGKYYCSLVLFSLLNLFIYLGLCSFFIGIEPIEYFLQQNTLTKEYSEAEIIQPVIIALMYFGSGVARFKFAGKEIDIYQKILEAFQSLMAIELSTTLKIRESIQEATAEYKEVNELVVNLRSEADGRNWDKMEGKWKEVSSDIETLNKNIKSISDINEQLSDPLTHDKIDKIRSNIKKRVAILKVDQISKLKKYLAEFVIRNMKNEKDIDNLLLSLGVNANTEDYNPNIMLRCITICGLFGLLFGPIFFFTEDKNVVHYAWIGAASVGIFGLIFSLVRTIKKNPADLLIRAIVAGCLSGAAAHIVWMVLTSYESQGKVNIDFSQLVFGIEFGIILALTIYLFNVIELKLSNSFKFMILSFTGGIGFILLGVLNGLPFEEGATGPDISNKFIMLFLLGSVVASGLALGVNIFPKTSDRHEHPT